MKLLLTLPRFDTALSVLTLCLVLPLLLSCSRGDAVRIATAAATGDVASAAEGFARSKATSYATNPMAFISDVKRFGEILEAFRKAVSGEWGDDVLEPQPKVYVKYTQAFKSRAVVDFDQGFVRVETVDKKQPEKSLREAIVTSLLTPDDPRALDLYDAGKVTLGGVPFLLNEVLDHEGKPIRWEWRAGRYADYLLKTALKTRNDDGRTVRYVQFPMVSDHLHVRARKYKALVENAAKRFGVSRNLVYAIMKVESDFNPFAVSHAMAVGLMQVVPKTAGGDVYRYLNGRKGKPTVNQLFDAPTNITYGTCYLHLLQTRYLSGVADPVSREYCVIAGYNGGAGNVLRTFDSDRKKAYDAINGMKPGDLYAKLREDLPHAETRRYLYKVMAAKKDFVNFK